MPGWDFTHVQDDVKLYILRMLEGTFSLGTAQIIYRSQIMQWKHPRNIRWICYSRTTGNDIQGIDKRIHTV